MSFPLYDATLHPEHPQFGQIEGNAGLYFERFFSWSQFSVVGHSYKRDKKSFLEKFKHNKLGKREAIERLAINQIKLTEAVSGSHFCMKSDWHWVTGLGNSHPLENGFCWHPTLGLPFLPASSVKGLCRAWLEQQIDDDLNDQEKTTIQGNISRWFGNNDEKSGAATSGGVVFFDALPLSEPDILPDVITPHTGDWQENGASGNTAPADWHDPIPVGFLVCRNLELLFSLAPAAHSDVTATEIEDIQAQLSEALGFMGAGAKTATGYGTMSLSKAPPFLANIAKLLDNLREQQLKQAFDSLPINQRIIHDLDEKFASESGVVVKTLLENRVVFSWPKSDQKELARVFEKHEFAIIKGKVDKKSRDRRNKRQAWIDELKAD